MGHQTTIAEQAESWQSPQSRDWRSGLIEAETAAKHLGSRPLNEQVMNWPTPNAHPTAPNNGTTRENGRKAQRITDQCLDTRARNHRSTSLVQGWGRLALSMTFENFTDEALAELGNAIRPNSETPSPGPTCWCDTPGCDLPSHKRKLSPIFVSVLMNWSPWFLTAEPSRSGLLATEFFRSRRARLLSNWFGGTA